MTRFTNSIGIIKSPAHRGAFYMLLKSGFKTIFKLKTARQLRVLSVNFLSMAAKYHLPTVLLTLLLTSCARGVTHFPLPNSMERATPLSFGMYVTPTPEQNPINPPERFSGYHAALDYEVSDGEVDGDVPVYAICKGEVLFSGYVNGYGGTVVHRCKLDGEHVTVLYGHLDLSGLPEEGDVVHGGQTIGLLAAPRSRGSGFTRKHLHLGIHKGRRLTFAGYVDSEEALQNYLDPAEVFIDLPINNPAETPGEVPYWKDGTEESAGTE